MTAEELVYPVLSALAVFVCSMAIPLLGLALLHMIGRHQ
jgi:hypothetical protein